MSERRTYWQGQVDAKLAQMAADIADIKTGVNSLKLWRAKVLGAAVAVSGAVSWLLHWAGVGK